MEIVATYRYNARDYHKFGTFHVFHKCWLKTFRLPILMMAAAIILTGLTFIIRRNMITLAIVCFGLALLLPLLVWLLQRAKINKNMSRDTSFRWSQNTYRFGEDTFELVIKTGKREERATYTYAPLHACYETGTHFFLYANTVSAFILPKAQIQGGADALRALLYKKMGSRFHSRMIKKGEHLDGAKTE